MNKKRIYISPPSDYEKACAKNYFSDKKLGVAELKGGIVMPHSGDIFGIYDSHFKNVVSLDRMSPKPRDKIEHIKNLTHCDESVIYAGCSFVYFGHILLEGLSRLWFVLANAQDSRKLVFVGYL